MSKTKRTRSKLVRANISLPKNLAERLRTAVRVGDARSVSEICVHGSRDWLLKHAQAAKVTA